MTKVIDIRETIANGLATEEEVERRIKEKLSRNLWDVKKEVVLNVIEQNYIPQEVKEAQRQAVDELFTFAKSAVNSRVPFPLVRKIVDKKSEFLVDAKTVAEVKEIMRLSVSHFKGNGFVVTGKYHIPEEEMLLLGIASKMGKLTVQAQERFVYLYEHYYRPKGEVVNE